MMSPTQLRMAWVAALMTAASPAMAEAPSVCERLLVSSTRPPVLSGIPRFAATETVDLDFNVVFPQRFGGKHLLKVELFTPNGHLYQRLSVPLDDAVSTLKKRSVRGFPRPLAVKRLQPFELAGASRTVAKVRFPLAGTSIVRSGLYGTWRADVFLDGAAEVCVSAQFELVDRPGRR